MARKPDHVTLNLRASREFAERLESAVTALETSKSSYIRRAVQESLMRDEQLLQRA